MQITIILFVSSLCFGEILHTYQNERGYYSLKIPPGFEEISGDKLKEFEKIFSQQMRSFTHSSRLLVDAFFASEGPNRLIYPFLLYSDMTGYFRKKTFFHVGPKRPF